jgi:hypothetical protein
VDAVCHHGVVVVRLPDLDVTAPLADQFRRAADGWQVAPSMRVWVAAQAQRHGGVPFVATVSGFVALGADLTKVQVVRTDGA